LFSNHKAYTDIYIHYTTYLFNIPAAISLNFVEILKNPLYSRNDEPFSYVSLCFPYQVMRFPRVSGES